MNNLQYRTRSGGKEGKCRNQWINTEYQGKFCLQVQVWREEGGRRANKGDFNVAAAVKVKW